MNYLRKLFKKQVDSNSGKQNLPASGAEDHNLSSVQQTFPKPYLTNMVTYGCREDSVTPCQDAACIFLDHLFIPTAKIPS